MLRKGGQAGEATRRWGRGRAARSRMPAAASRLWKRHVLARGEWLDWPVPYASGYSSHTHNSSGRTYLVSVGRITPVKDL